MHSRFQADTLIREHAVAYSCLVQAILATAPNGKLGGTGATHTITAPATDVLIGGGCLLEYVLRSLTAAFNDAADRLALADELPPVMDAVFPMVVSVPALRLVTAGGAS
ncbi:hypothetical protein [Streptomyces lydicus]|uniref:hypothetical protein n=1 Tax=Streptomyces lydicus TaxID=47763 RepID=UPI00379C8EC8